MLLWGSWGWSPCRAPCAQHPCSWGPHCPARPDSQTFSQTGAALHSGRCEVGDDWLEGPFAKKDTLFCFAFTRFDLYRTKSFSSPWRKVSLLIPVKANTPHTALCRNCCAMTHGCFNSAVKQAERDCWAQQQLHLQLPCPTHSKFRQWSSKCWIQLVWCAVVGVPKPWAGSGFGCGKEPWACGSFTGTGAQADDGEQNLGRGKEARSFADISAKSVPGPTFVNFLLFVFVPAILNELFPSAA